MRVMGIDSSLRHSGWLVQEFQPDALRPLMNPHPTHPLMHHVAGGTINSDDTSEPRLDRFILNAKKVHQLVDLYKPEIVVIEGALDKGLNRSPTGTAMYVLIVSRWHPLSLVATTSSFPQVIITISPERHMSLAHQRRSLTGTEKVKAYRKFATEIPKGRVSEHQADAFFLAYHGTRFWLVKTGRWPSSILTPHEQAIFFDSTVRHPKTNRRIASKHMSDEVGRSWWIVMPEVLKVQSATAIDLPVTDLPNSARSQENVTTSESGIAAGSVCGDQV
jgi:hypothetical protein